MFFSSQFSLSIQMKTLLGNNKKVFDILLEQNSELTGIPSLRGTMTVLL